MSRRERGTKRQARNRRHAPLGMLVAPARQMPLGSGHVRREETRGAQRTLPHVPDGGVAPHAQDGATTRGELLRDGGPNGMIHAGADIAAGADGAAYADGDGSAADHGGDGLRADGGDGDGDGYAGVAGDGDDVWAVEGLRRRRTALLARVSAPPERDAIAPRTFTWLELRTRLRAHGATLAQDGWLWLRTLTTEQWLWIGVLALATILRFWGLGDKPLHHDESMHAFYSLLFAEDPSSYIYNPLLHGPFQFHAEGLMFAIILALEHIFRVATAYGNPWINDTTARIVPALFGIGIVALPVGLRRELGHAGALIAAFVLAISPTFVYFSRFLREDIYFNFFMFAMVVGAVRFARARSTRWFVTLCVATVLAYATFEGIYLTLAIFGAFLALLVVWELAHGLARVLPGVLTAHERLLFSRACLLLLAGALGGALALVGLHILNTLSDYVNTHATQSALQVQQLENVSVAVLLYISIVIALAVIATLVWQLTHDDSPQLYPRLDDDESASALEPAAARPARRGSPRWARAHVLPEQQPLLHLVLGISWMQWFVAFVLSWIVFAALYWVIPGPQSGVTLGQGFAKGVGLGLWQGLYYWLQQQHVARGGQPWYYYLLLIPLYEQLAIVFGCAGAIYAVLRPTRFRLFLVWWFVASLGLYSWAGEKMPWLSIHILLPLMLLAGLALGRAYQECAAVLPRVVAGGLATLRALPRRAYGAAFALALGVVLLVPMAHSMLVLSHQDAANGPLEMMVYVQTTNDVNTVMNKITRADQLVYGGKHELRIAIGQGEEWPFYWYLRDYYLNPHPYATAYFDYNFTSAQSPPIDVLILTPSDAQAFMALHPTGWKLKQYRLRAWWDEAYKPPPCVATRGHPCPASANWGSGVGLGLYLSYGSNPPAHAQFNAGLAAQRLWNWLWFRKPLGATNGSYNFDFIVRDGVPISP